MKAGLLLKDIWRLNGKQWNDDIPDAIVAQFLEWGKKLPLLSEIAIPRSNFQETVEGLELHIVGDNSQDVFSMVDFLRGKLVTNGTETTELAFILGKARVAPMRCVTIPKLVLQAALLASRLRQEVLHAVSLMFERCFMWTDSTTVLQWLHSLEKQPVFVANRVTEILELMLLTNGIMYERVITLQTLAIVGCLPLLCSRAAA